MCEPMKPAPPVTSTLIGRGFIGRGSSAENASWSKNVREPAIQRRRASKRAAASIGLAPAANP